MRVSIVVAILDSPEVVRRQLLHFEKIGLPDDVEVVYVDDGSLPPLRESINQNPSFNFSLHETNDLRPWTQPAARNRGAREAKGEYCIFTDIDHILSKELIMTVYQGKHDVVRFRRELGVLDENGDFTQDLDVLHQYGYKGTKLRISPHTNSFGFKRSVFFDIGCMPEKRVGLGIHPNQEETPVRKKYWQWAKEGRISVNTDEERPVLYMIPNGRFCGDDNYNPFGLFHDLKRNTRWAKSQS